MGGCDLWLLLIPSMGVLYIRTHEWNLSTSKLLEASLALISPLTASATFFPGSRFLICYQRLSFGPWRLDVTFTE